MLEHSMAVIDDALLKPTPCNHHALYPITASIQPVAIHKNSVLYNLCYLIISHYPKVKKSLVFDTPQVFDFLNVDSGAAFSPVYSTGNVNMIEKLDLVGTGTGELSTR